MNIPLRLKLSVLKRIVMILGLYEWAALLIATYWLGAKEIEKSFWFLLSYALSYWVSYELSFIVQHWIIRQELEQELEK